MTYLPKIGFHRGGDSPENMRGQWKLSVGIAEERGYQGHIGTAGID
jgi:hypothetical protein